MRSYDIVEFGEPLKQVDRAEPVPAGTEVLLKTLATGVCHSDLHIWDGYYDIGGGKRFSLRDRGLAPPITLGHEIAGEVVALGPDATGVKLGDKRVIFPWIGCGTCAVCARGDEHLCNRPRSLGIQRPGGFADRVLVPHARYLLPLGRLSAAEAAPYACSGLTTFGALKKVGAAVFRKEPILVIGAGGLGLMCLTLLKAQGGRGAVVADIDPKKRQAALDAGALAAIDAAAPDAVKQAQAAAKAPLAAAIDFVGAGPTARLGIDAVARGGKYVIVGLFGGDITLALPFLPIRAITIQGSFVGSLAEFKELMALVEGGAVLPVPRNERALGEAEAALRDLREGRVVGRTILTP
ncbi:MAG TPA: alcohol dehydrogenase [Stellaceae bacterium]|nr:alcohol dehydrogenase [Stellaceae bacterium]